MKLSSQRANRTTTIELSMTSMIDVVFLLLIFFMVTTSFRKTERELEPAVKKRQQASASAQSDFEPVIIEVIAQGDQSIYRLGAASYQTDEELLSVLNQLGNKQDGSYVKVSDKSHYGAAARAMQACKSAGFDVVSYVPWDGE